MNTFYHGDCLFVLKHDITPESVDLIYLDPPFFTSKIQKGTKKWQPGAMEISFEDSKSFWADKADVMREKAPAWLRHIALKRPAFASYL
jgi:DNA modification methylase